jgi:hypothetical protein
VVLPTHALCVDRCHRRVSPDEPAPVGSVIYPAKSRATPDPNTTTTTTTNNNNSST